MTATFTGIEAANLTITSSMFGGNNMFEYNIINGQNASFNDAANLLGVTGIRFPGGSMTENDFDVSNPDSKPLGWPEGKSFVGITEFLNYAAAAGRETTIVLPTAKTFSGEIDHSTDEPRSLNMAYIDEVKHYVERLLTHGDTGPDALPDTPISTFEIGNEYWGSGAMTATEYGLLVNTLCAELAEIFGELLGDRENFPKVIIQTGDPWGSQFSEGIYSSQSWADREIQCNRNIIDQLTNPNSISVITGLATHYYYSPPGATFSQDSQSVNYIDQDIAIWAAAGFGDRDLAITEWNVKQDNAAQFGLKGASVLIEQMERMVEMGVDSAFAWPVQGWKTGLAGGINSEPILSPAGVAFQMMAKDLVGLHPLEENIGGGPLEINGFTSDTKTVIFVSSRSDTAQFVSLDVSSLVSGYSNVSGIKIGVAEGISTSDPSAAAVTMNYSIAELMKLGTLEFNLGPFEIMEVIFTLPPGLSTVGSSISEKLHGSFGGDTMLGNGGNDSITGGRGLDSIDGGLGNDLLSGWGGNDHVYGGLGNDLVFGQPGFDYLYGGQGRDSINGGDDDDRLDGGLGSDSLTGGNGADMFIFSTALGGEMEIDTISDMQSGQDKIVLDNDAFKGLWSGKLSDSAFCLSSVSAAADWSDRVIYNTRSGDISFDQDGSRSVFTSVVFAHIQPGLELTFGDFIVI